VTGFFFRCPGDRLCRRPVRLRRHVLAPGSMAAGAAGRKEVVKYQSDYVFWKAA